MNRVIFLNRYFYPDHSATSQLLSDLAFHLAASGEDVHVITSQQLYDLPQSCLAPREFVRGVQVHRVATTQFGRSALLGRAIDYLSYYRATSRALMELVHPGDIVVAKTDPPLLSIVAARVAKRRGAYLVNWLQDIYPEVALELGVPFLKGPIGRGITQLRNRSLSHAVNVAVGDRMAQRVVSLGITAAHVHVIPNWCDDEAIAPVPHGSNPLRRAWNFENKFVVGYCGNLGRAHEFDTLIEAAKHLCNHSQIVFLCVGGGHHFDRLSRCVDGRGLGQTFRFMPYQGQDSLKYVLGAADVHWISLKPQLEGLLVPSKFYGVAAAGRPVIAISSADGEIGRLVQRYDCGVVIEPGQGQALADAIDGLSRDTARLEGMGQRARAMLDENFSRKQAFQRWQQVFKGIEAELNQR